MVAVTLVVLIAASLAGAFAAADAARRTWHAHRLLGLPSLRRLTSGFALLAVSQLLVSLLELVVASQGDALPLGTVDALDVLFWAYYGTLLGGLAAVFASFGRHPFRWAPVVGPVVAVAGPLLQFATIAVLFFVVLHAGLNHIARRGSGSGWAAIGFFLVFFGHVANLVGYLPLRPRWWAAELLVLAGFVVLWWGVARPRPGSHA